MRRCASMFPLILLIVVPLCFSQYTSVHANDTKRVYITEVHVNSLIEHTVQPQQLKILNIEGIPNELGIALQPGIFRVSYFIPKSSTEYNHSYTFIWITPQLNNGQVTCSITQFKVGDQLFTGEKLTKPNPYLGSLDATPYCNLFLFPFLKGYGSSSRIASFKLQNHMVWLDIGGTIAPDAPPPVVVAKCEVYISSGNWSGTALTNFRSAPSLDAPVLRRLESGSEAFLLGWKGDWLKIDYQGQIGWVIKYFAYGGVECVSDYFSVSTLAWDRGEDS